FLSFLPRLCQERGTPVMGNGKMVRGAKTYQFVLRRGRRRQVLIAQSSGGSKWICYALTLLELSRLGR
ncbi:MAG: hypothetical protein WCS94_08415, partial [Verrucomicrobiota bacterium]